MAELPTGTVTFLFTDLEGSTRLWEEHPDAMRPALARHDAILRNAIEARGYVVKTTGDGFHAAFATAHDAVAAAIGAQLSLDAEHWDATGPLRVRMGLHTCEAELRDGDYYGNGVNRASRLMSAAHGGQIVLSRATEEVSRDSLADGVDIVDLGEHRLRDLARPERVYQVVHALLSRDFRPLKTFGTVRSNLPAQVTSFVGRDHEVERIGALLAESPLVTLIGVGGVGKTRLAVHAAADAADRFADGAWFCDLAPVYDAESMALTIATAIGMAQRADVSVTQALLDLLAIKEMLLILDNCEHLVDEVGRLSEQIIRSCQHVRLLVTTREALAVDGERLWPVRPLDLSDDADPTMGAAVRLFVDRVVALRPGFVLDGSNTEAAVEICRRLDGIPLAIELAAARARSLSMRDIADRLDRRFALLSGGRRGGVARHETLRAAVDWSYELLDESERAVLNRVSVFAGGFTVDGAEAVSDDGALDEVVFDVVTRLTDKSLLVVDDIGTTRYRMLETIRQYALSKLDDAGDAAATRDRHLAFFVEFATQAAPGLFSADEFEWADRVESELENLRAAVTWAAETGDADSALRIATSFGNQGFVRHAWGLAALAEAALLIPGAQGHELAPHARIFHAHLHLERGNYDAAVDLCNEVLARAGPSDHLVRARAEGVLGDVALRDARDDPAAHFERASEAAALANASTESLFYREFAVIGSPNRGAEYLDGAVAEAEKLLPLARNTGCPTLIANAEFPLGYMLTLRGDDRAIEHLTRGVESRSGLHMMGGLPMIALYHSIHGSPAEALEVLERAMRMARGTGDRAMVVTAIDIAMQILARQGDSRGAAVLVSAMESGALPGVGRAGVPGERRARLVARLDEVMTPEDRDAARYEGLAMSYDEVVEFLLERIATRRAALVSELPRP